MAGFPNSPPRQAFGPQYRDKVPTRDPSRELGADAVNLAFWQAAGAGRTVPKAVLAVHLDGELLTPVVTYQALAWDSDGKLPPVAVARASVGVYSFTFDSGYADERGVLVPFLPQFAVVALTDPTLAGAAQVSGLTVTLRVVDASNVVHDSDFGVMVWG